MVKNKPLIQNQVLKIMQFNRVSFPPISIVHASLHNWSILITIFYLIENGVDIQSQHVIFNILLTIVRILSNIFSFFNDMF